MSIILISSGGLIGYIVAKRVQMTEMPQLVAALHSFVGLAAVFIGINSEIRPPDNLTGAEIIIHEIEIFLGIFILIGTTIVITTIIERSYKMDFFKSSSSSIDNTNLIKKC